MKKFLIMLALLFALPITGNALEFEEISKEEKYFKTTIYESNLTRASSNYAITEEITQEEYEAFNPNVMPLASTSTITTYKKLTTYLLTNGNYYRYKATLEWRNIPKVRSYDTIGIGHYSSVIIRGSTHFSQTYCPVDDDCRTISSYYEKITDTGSAATFKVPSGDLESLEQTFYFDVEKRNPSSTVIAQKSSGDYSHAIRSVTTTQARNFNISNAGIQYDSSVLDYFDEISQASVTWSGTW